MPSERIQRQIDRLLDDAETAVAAREWDRVRELARGVLAVDPENLDARAFLAMADGAGQPQSSPPEPSSAPALPVGRPASSVPPRPASFAAGRYRVERFLGEGGRKRVYLAHDARLDRDVAVAMIKTEGLDKAGLERVQREAQAMARLGDHPNIVTVFDVAEEAGQPLLVSQYMAGGSVEDLIARAEDHRLPVVDTLRIAAEVCHALEHAHRQGVVHRDLKPGNVWLTGPHPPAPSLRLSSGQAPTGGRGAGEATPPSDPHSPLLDGRGAVGEGITAKLGDFGLAVALDRSRVTMAGMMLGTVAYMPPEQALGGESTPKADLYSLGCMLYEMVTGRPPFLGEDPTAVISQHINTPPVAPSWLTDRCPPELEEVIVRLLAKNPEDRPASAGEVGAALARVDPEKKSQSHSDSTENPLDRLARGVFVGRQAQLEKLRKAFDEAFAGRGGLVMLVGEPGIGKTRTCQELETYARMRGAQVFWGRTHESGGAPPYWPWLQVGRAWGASTDPATLITDMGSEAGQLVRLFPDLAQIPNFPKPEDIADPESAQFRLFDAFASFVRVVSSRTPLLVTLDDLHWADKPSLLLLQHLARDLSRLRVLIVGNYRDTELSRAHPLSEALAVLNRDPGFERIALRGLTQPEAATYIRAAANVEPKPELVRRIFEETEGNPFFLSEVVNLMAQEGTLTRESVSDLGIPDGVREALGRRLDRLSEDANELLKVAAVVGREFAFDMLSLVGERSEDELVRLIEEAVRGRVIEEMEQAGRYRFSHALMQETLLEELTTTRRVRLHGQVAEALERRWGDRLAAERAPRLARHFIEAATLTPRHAAKAVRYSKLAAEQAEAQSAWDEAAHHYEACLTLVTGWEDDPSTGSGQALGEDDADLLIALGRCLRYALEPRAAWRNLMRAITLCKQRGDAAGVARATLEAAPIPSPPGRMDALLREAVDLLGDAEPYLKARLILDRSNFGRRLDEAEMRRIEEILQQHDFPDVAAGLSLERGTVALADMRFEDAWREYDRAYDGLLKHGRINEAGFLIHYRGIMPLVLGDLTRGKQAAEDALRLVREIHAGFWEVNLLLRLAGLALACGQPQEFAALLGQIVPNYGRDLLRAAQAEVSGDLVRAQTLLPAMVAGGGVPSWVAQIHAARARILFHLGDTEGATAELNAFQSALDHVPKYRFSLGRFFPILEADEAIALLSEYHAREFYEELVSCAPLRWDPFALSGAERIKGALAIRLGLIDEAERHFRDGLEWSEREGLRLEAGRCLLRLADIAEGRGQTREALQHLDRAIALFQQHGARLYLDRALAAKVRLQGIGSGMRSIDAVAESVQSEHPDLAPVAAPDGSVTIFVSDIEDSTGWNERLGDAHWLEVLREHNEVMRRHIAAHGGFEVKTIGDAFMVVFADPLAALRCAVDVQRAFQVQEQGTGNQEQGGSGSPHVPSSMFPVPIEVRIGLHTGEAVRDQDDFYGTNVTLAFRIAAQGAGGQVLVSALLKELTESSGAFKFDDGQEVELKGLSGRHRVYEVQF